MPNWCENTVILVGPSKWINKFKHTAKTGIDFARLYPPPDHIKKDKASFADGFAWMLENYGARGTHYEEITKEQRLGRKEKILAYSFSTAWSPPIAFFKNISKQYKNTNFHLFFSESGDDYIGYTHVKNGGFLKDVDASYPSTETDEPDDEEEIRCIRSWYENACTTETVRAYWRSV